MMQRHGRMLHAPSWRPRCHGLVALASLWRLSRLLAALCTREIVPLSRAGPNGHPTGGCGAAVGPGRSRRFLRLASLNTQARPLRGRFRSQAWRRGRRRGGAAAQQEETSLTPEQVALAHRRTPGRFIAPARQVAVSHRLTARCQSGGVGAAPSTVCDVGVGCVSVVSLCGGILSIYISEKENFDVRWFFPLPPACRCRV